MPTSCCEIATPPTSQVSFGNGLGNARTSAAQIRLTSPLKIRTSADRDDHDVVSSGAPLDRADDDALGAEPEPKAITSVSDEGEPLVQPWFSISVQAM